MAKRNEGYMQEVKRAENKPKATATPRKATAYGKSPGVKKGAK